MAYLAQLYILSAWLVFGFTAILLQASVRGSRVQCHAATHAFAVIAVGAESLEVSQHMDDDAAVSQSSENSEFIIVDALITFVSQQDYIVAATQLHALLNVCNARGVASLYAPFFFLSGWQAHVEQFEAAIAPLKLIVQQWSSHVMFKISRPHGS